MRLAVSTSGLLLFSVAAAACSSSHGPGDDPHLEPDALGSLGTGTASDRDRDAASAASAAGAASGDGGEASAGALGAAGYQPSDTDTLQVWIGKTRGTLWSCDDPPPWDGVIREYRTVLLLWVGPDGAARGATVAFGEGPSPAPARDPEAFLPADTAWPEALCPTNALVEGFDYPGHRVRLSDGRLELTLYRHDFYASWCALQTSFPASEAAQQQWGQDYYCRDTSGVMDELGANALLGSTESADLLCLGSHSRVCACDERGCEPWHVWPHVIDLVVDGDDMEGWLTEPAYTSQMRLARQR